MGSLDSGVLLGLPIIAATFLTLLLNGVSNLVFISIGAIALAAVAAGLSQILSGASFQIFGTGVTFPEMTGWFLRFLFTTTFLTTYYTANILTGINLILEMPFYLGVLIVGVLSSMFVWGLFTYSSSDSGG